MIKHEPITSCSLILTEGCNLNCSYCFEKDKNHKAIMTKETARRAVDFLVQEAVQYNQSKISITYFGGEPLLNLEVLEDSFDYGVEQCKKNNINFDCMIITNCTLFTDAYGEFIKKWYATLGRVGIQLSIDGVPEIQDSNRVYHDGEGSSNKVEEIVAKYLAFFKENNIPTDHFSVHSVLTKTSVRRMHESYKYFKSLGLENIWNMPLHEENWDEEDAEIFRSELLKIKDDIVEVCKKEGNDLEFKKYSSISRCVNERPDKPCAAGCNFITITTDGKFYPCHHFYFADKELCIGSLDEGILDEERMLFVEYGFENVFGDMPCSNCDNKACYTCIAANYMHNGNLLIGFPEYCTISRIEDEIRKELSLELDDLGLHNSIYKKSRRRASTSKTCKCKEKDPNHECTCGDSCSCGSSTEQDHIEILNTLDQVIEEVEKDREAFKNTLKAADENTQALENRIKQMDEKLDTLLDVMTLVSSYLIQHLEGQKDE